MLNITEKGKSHRDRSGVFRSSMWIGCSLRLVNTTEQFSCFQSYHKLAFDSTKNCALGSTFSNRPGGRHRTVLVVRNAASHAGMRHVPQHGRRSCSCIPPSSCVSPAETNEGAKNRRVPDIITAFRRFDLDQPACPHNFRSSVFRITLKCLFRASSKSLMVSSFLFNVKV